MFFIVLTGCTTTQSSYSFIGSVKTVKGNSATLITDDLKSFGDNIEVVVSLDKLYSKDITEGTKIKITFNGNIQETYPLHVYAQSIQIIND